MAIKTVPDPEFIRFIVCTRDAECVWSCGQRQSFVEKARRKGYDRGYPGANLCGHILNDMAIQLKTNGAIHYTFGFPRLLTKTIYTNDHYQQTILILSDSQLRYVENIRGRQIICVSGGTLNRLMNKVIEQNLCVSDFDTIIINCGINDSQKPYKNQ